MKHARRRMRFGPFKRIVSRSERTFSTIHGLAGSRVETLECGHTVAMKRRVSQARRRRCNECAR